MKYRLFWNNEDELTSGRKDFDSEAEAEAEGERLTEEAEAFDMCLLYAVEQIGA